MAKKTKRKPKKRVKRKAKVKKRTRKRAEEYCGKTEEEWKAWGEEFGKHMEKGAKEFGDDMGECGERFGRHMEQRGKRLEKRWQNWWYRTFGPIWPLIGSVFGIVFVVFGILILRFINIPLGSAFIAEVSNFMLRNLLWLFAAFVFFGYMDYFSRRYPRVYWIISPIASSIGIVIAVWIVTWLLDLINTALGSTAISTITSFLSENLMGIFVLFLVLGYAVVLIKRFIINMSKF